MNNQIPIQATSAQMASSVSRAGVRVIRDTLRRRGSLVTDDIYTSRLEVCEGCSLFRNDKRCSKCGCQMNLKAKFKFAECPEGKWSREA